MRKALVITYYWPPSGGAGVQRWLKFVKYLRGFGWEPVIFTPENPEFPETDMSLMKDVPEGLSVVRLPIWEPYNAYKKFIGRKKEDRINSGFLSESKHNPLLESISVWIRGNLFIPDARRFWISPASKFLKKQLRKDQVDVVISTGPPHSMHLVAMKVAGELNLPWLADFRDPWTSIDFYSDLKLSAAADRKHRRLEKTVLERASAVTVVSASMASDFEKIVSRNYEVITNGYDEEDTYRNLEPASGGKFSIAHIGTLTATRNPIPLWEALKELVATEPGFAADLEVTFIGKADHTVTDSIRESGLAEFVTRTDYMPHDEVIRCQQQAQVLLLIINNTPNARMILTGKFFEYLSARRPILCLGPVDGDAAAVLEETNSGLISGFGDTAGMKRNILSLYKRFREGDLSSNSRNIGKYSRKALTARMAVILDRISSGS